MLEKEHWKKIARLETNPASVSQGNTIINFGILFSTEQKSFVFVLGKTSHINMPLHRLGAFN